MMEEILEDVDGIIQSIYVENFFCHKRLNMNLDPNLNFIVGRNGSGKSAILSALVVGLGARASATNRGSNLNSLIRKDASEENRTAVIKIKLKNSSPRAYKHDVYGDSITIVRKIRAGGSSTYEIQSATGAVISTRFEEVQSITLAHDIQVDNPISVLNQDDARSFHGSDAKKKYALFKRATKLDVTETNYNRTQDECKMAKINLNKKLAASAGLEKEYKKWKHIFKQYQSRDDIKAQEKMLQNEYNWSQIVELEKDANKLQEQYDRENIRINKLVAELHTMDQSHGSGTINALKEKLDEVALQKTGLEQELHDLETDLSSKQQSLRVATNSEHKYNDQLVREQKKKTDIEEEMQKVQSGGSGREQQQLERAAAAARQAATAAAARRDTAAQFADQARQHAARAAAAADTHRAAYHAHLPRLKQLKQQLRELESRGGDSLAVFGGNMAELCQRLRAAANKFSVPPKGPIGAFIKVKDKKWAGVLEHIIGGSIRSFCVNNAEDSRKLFAAMNQVYGSSPKPAVTSSKFLPQQHDVRRRSVRARGYTSALDAIQLTDPVIANYLIDNLELERILLVPTHEEAIKLADTVENVPENCKMLVTLDCTDYYPAPNYRCYSGFDHPPTPRYLQCSTEQRKRQLQEEIQVAESELRSLEARAKEASEEAREAKEAEMKATKTEKALINEAYSTATKATMAESALEQHHAPQHDLLLDELNVNKEKLSTLSEQLQNATNQKQIYQQQIDELNVRMSEVKKKLEKLNRENRTIVDEYQQEQIKRDRGASHYTTLKRRVQEDQGKLARVADVLQGKGQEIAKAIQKAERHCQRIENPREKSVVEDELKKTKLKLTTYRNNELSREEVAANLASAEDKYKENTKLLTELSALIEKIESTTDKHRIECFNKQKYIVLLMQQSFKAILDLQGYSGDMIIDHERETLEISCTGRESSAKRHASSTSSLSGGERSYSMVAFIMALWECVELPFYCMDECDVFMDFRNRKVVMDLLIDYAVKNSNRQFMFLTPQDSSTLISSSNLSIHMMPDPIPSN